MNIFILDYSPKRAAKYHCDKHVVKMVLETAQLLSSAHHYYNDPIAQAVYKPTHQNHPCAIWIREAVENYQFGFELLDHLLQEFEKRYGHPHKTARLLTYLQYPPDALFKTECTPFIQCVPDDCKRPDPVEAYRAYYCKHKTFATWNYGPTPEWYSRPHSGE